MLVLPSVLIVFAAVVGVSSASAEILAFATRTHPFQSSSTSAVRLPLNDNGATAVRFTTTAKNQLVTVTYNAECVVDAGPNSILSVRIFVDGDEAEPAPGSPFRPFCDAIDATGSVVIGGHWTAAVRQSVIRVRAAGEHLVRVFANLPPTRPGIWRIDDASLVVEGSPLAAATMRGGVGGDSTSEVAVPLRDNGAKALHFETTRKNELVRITYNAVCSVNAPRGTWVSVRIVVDGKEAEPASAGDFALCSDTRTSFDVTETAVLRQAVIRVLEPGKHVVRVLGRLASSAPVDGEWVLSGTSLVIHDAVLAAATRTANFFTGSASEVQLPLRDSGVAALQFTTTRNKQLVTITYNAECGVFGAPRGRSVSVRITVDDVEAQPASGPNFRMCTALDETGNTWVAATRQSIIRVPKAGKHVVRVFGRLLNGAGAWSLDDSSLVVE